MGRKQLGFADYEQTTAKMCTNKDTSISSMQLPNTQLSIAITDTIRETLENPGRLSENRGINQGQD
jgi:hypothetical protein